MNKVYSDNTELQYAYYDLPFVCPATGQHKTSGGLLSGQSIPLNLGEVLRGDRIVTSDIELGMAHDKPCQVLCNKQVTREDLERARNMVEDGYVSEWIVDNLPGATRFVHVDKTKKYYAAGFKLGYTEMSPHSNQLHYYINNHHTIVIRYRAAPGRAGERGEKIIVGFEVYPKSIGMQNKRDAAGCPVDLKVVEGAFELEMKPNGTAISSNADGSDDDTMTIPFTYSVFFRQDDSIEWAHRWDMYFVNKEGDSRTHWMAIFASLSICGPLTSIVLVLLAKTIRTDIKGHRDSMAEKGKARSKRKQPRAGPSNKAPGLLDQGADVEEDDDISDDDEALEDVTGWKLLHADVFRTPAHGYLMAPLVGSGMQLLFMAIGLVLLSALGVLNPSFRGGFISVGVGLFVLAGVCSGYFSARVFKSFEGKDWRRNAMVTALLFPGLSFGLTFILNLFVWAQASSTAIPFGTLVAILVLWLCVQVPLVYIGAYLGYERSATWEHPTRTASIARQIPTQPWYLQPVPSALLAGIIPFAVIFIELLYVFQSVWQDKSGFYYTFGFLAVVSVILLVTVAEVTIVTMYMQLCMENHRWWWQSFLVGGGSAVWVFVYSIWFYLFKLHISGFASSLLFFAYSFMTCCVYGLLTGTVGFLTAYTFVRRIYG